jgi:hypothetical protein
MPLECTADLDKGRALCSVAPEGRSPASPMSDLGADIWLHLRSDNHVYLEARNGARLANPNAAETDCRKTAFPDYGVRVDGLGPSSDLCLRTNEKALTHTSSSRAKYNPTANRSRSIT